MSSADASAYVTEYTSVIEQRLGGGTLPVLADDLDPDDRDLANRVVQTVGAGSRWLALSLQGAYLESVSGPREERARGVLHPLLVTRLGEPVAAYWTSDDMSERVYVLPEGHNWSQTLRWLVERCLPRHAPAGFRALRRDLLEIPATLLNAEENDATTKLSDLEAEYAPLLGAARKAVEGARASADRVREGLLYGTGSELVDAVAGVLRDAGLDVEDLDARFGDTISADLLVRDGGRRVLVEVKSSNQAAGQDLATKLAKHLATWSKLAPTEPVERGVLLVNHQLRLPPRPAKRTRVCQR